MKKPLNELLNLILFISCFTLIINVSSGYCFLNELFKIDKRTILNWNDTNKDKLFFNVESSNNYRNRNQYSMYEHFFCLNGGLIKNDTNNIIQQIIIPLQFLSNQQVILKKYVCLNIKIFPTALVKINQCFYINSNELYNLSEQLKENYGWRYDKVIFIPKLKKLSDDPVKNLGIKIDYYFDYDADKQQK